MTMVYLVRGRYEPERLYSIWTTRALADAAVLYYQAKGVHVHVVEWQVNVTFEQAG